MDSVERSGSSSDEALQANTMPRLFTTSRRQLEYPQGLLGQDEDEEIETVDECGQDGEDEKLFPSECSRRHDNDEILALLDNCLGDDAESAWDNCVGGGAESASGLFS